MCTTQMVQPLDQHSQSYNFLSVLYITSNLKLKSREPGQLACIRKSTDARLMYLICGTASQQTSLKISCYSPSIKSLQILRLPITIFTAQISQKLTLRPIHPPCSATSISASRPAAAVQFIPLSKRSFTPLNCRLTC